MLSQANLAEHRALLGPGDSLVMFTDGLSEAGPPDAQFGYEPLERLLADAGALAAEALADRIEWTAAAYRRGPPRDDQALLVLQVLENRDVADGASRPG